MKATLVPDIRRFQYLPGAVQFDAAAHAVFFSCPCGCGQIGEIPQGEAWVQRKPLSAYKSVVGADGKAGQGAPLVLRLIELVAGNEVAHWEGVLLSGEFRLKPGVSP